MKSKKLYIKGDKIDELLKYMQIVVVDKNGNHEIKNT